MGKLTTDAKSVAGIDTVKATSEDISEDNPEKEEEDSDYDLLDILAEGKVTCVSLFFESTMLANGSHLA